MKWDSYYGNAIQQPAPLDRGEGATSRRLLDRRGLCKRQRKRQIVFAKTKTKERTAS